MSISLMLNIAEPLSLIALCLLFKLIENKEITSENGEIMTTVTF